MVKCEIEASFPAEIGAPIGPRVTTITELPANRPVNENVLRQATHDVHVYCVTEMCRLNAVFFITQVMPVPLGHSYTDVSII